MTRHLTRTLLAVVCAIAAPSLCSAQGTGMIWGEFGNQMNELGDGASKSGMGWGFGVNFVTGGKSQKDWAILGTYAVEVRTDKPFEFTDFTYSGDLGFRVKNFAFGPGLNFSQLYRPNAFDPRCFTVQGPQSSCVGNGQRNIGQVYGFGWSAYAKASFGPQGRAFVQGKMIDWPTGWAWLRHPNETVGGGFAVPTDYPEIDFGRDFRISGGYVFPLSRASLLVRAQFIHREIAFMPELANTTYIFDQHSHQLSVGVGIAF